MKFYEIAVQVIPVLFLALTFESKLLLREPADPSHALDVSAPPGAAEPQYWSVNKILVAILITLALGAAEAAALGAIYFEKESDTLDAIIWHGLGFGLFGVILIPIAAQIHYLSIWRRAVGKKWRRQFIPTTMLLLFLLMSYYSNFEDYGLRR